MAWRAAISSGSTAASTLTLPVLASFGPPVAPPSFSFALHAPPIKRTIESSDSSLSRRIETPLLVVRPPILAQTSARRSTQSGRDAPAPDDRRIPGCAVFRGPRLSREVDVDEAEALSVGLRRLDAVQQGPHEVAGQRDSGVDRGARGRDVVAEEGDPPFIVDDAIRCGLVGEGRPVLGHDDACRTVVTMQLDEEVGQALRFDGPAHRG